jgi:hypothetical protein
MFINYFLKCIHSKECGRLLPLAPILLIVGLFSLYSAMNKPLPEKGKLISFVGVITDLDNRSGLILFEGNQERLRFECICDYGWGYRSFDNSNSIHALVSRNSNADLYAWQLSINDKSIFTYEDLYMKKKRKKDEFIQFSICLILSSIAGFVFYAIVYFTRRRFPNIED